MEFRHTMEGNGVQNNTGSHWLLLCGQKTGYSVKAQVQPKMIFFGCFFCVQCSMNMSRMDLIQTQCILCVFIVKEPIPALCVSLHCHSQILSRGLMGSLSVHQMCTSESRQVISHLYEILLFSQTVFRIIYEEVSDFGCSLKSSQKKVIQFWSDMTEFSFLV